MSDAAFYSLVNAEIDLMRAIQRSHTLRKGIAAGDPDASADVFNLAMEMAEKVETRFLNGWAEDDEQVGDRLNLTINAAHRLYEAALFAWGWNTGKLIDPIEGDIEGRYGID